MRDDFIIPQSEALFPSEFLHEWYWRSVARRFHFGEEVCSCVMPGTPNGVLCEGCSVALERNAQVRESLKE